MRLGNNSVRKQNPPVTEIRDGLIVSRLIEKEQEPVIVDLQDYASSKAASSAVSANSVNKVREITEFMFSNGRKVSF